MELTGTSFPLLKGDGFQCFYHSRSSRLERFLRFPDGDGHNRAKACILESVIKKTPRQVFDDLANVTHGVSQQGFFLRLWVMDRVVQQCHRSAPSAYEMSVLFPLDGRWAEGSHMQAVLAHFARTFSPSPRRITSSFG